MAEPRALNPYNQTPPPGIRHPISRPNERPSTPGTSAEAPSLADPLDVYTPSNGVPEATSPTLPAGTVDLSYAAYPQDTNTESLGSNAYVGLTQSGLMNGQNVRWLLVNFSGLKWINDHWGHNAGNAYLLRVKAILEEVIGAPVQIVRQGPNFAVLLPENIDAAAVMERLEERLSSGVDFAYIRRDIEIIPASYSTATEGRQRIFNQELLVYDAAQQYSFEAVFAGFREGTYFLNGGPERESGRYTIPQIIGNGYRMVILDSQRLSTLNLDERLVGSEIPAYREDAIGSLTEDRSGAENVRALEGDALNLLLESGRMQLAVIDLNAIGAFRSLGPLGDLMIDAVLEVRVLEAAQVLEGMGITLYRHGGGSEEYYLAGDVSEEQMLNATRLFLEALNADPLVLRVEVSDLQSTAMGRQTLEYLRQTGQYQPYQYTFENGQSAQVVEVDLTRVIRGIPQPDGSYKTFIGLTGTAAMGEITRPADGESIEVRPRFRNHRFGRILEIFARGQESIMELVEKAKWNNPDRDNLVVKAGQYRGTETMFRDRAEATRGDYGMGRPVNPDPAPLEGETIGSRRSSAEAFRYANDPVAASNPQPASAVEPPPPIRMQDIASEEELIQRLMRGERVIVYRGVRSPYSPGQLLDQTAVTYSSEAVTLEDVVLERIRQREFPGMPSRLNSIFVATNPAIASHYGQVYEIEISLTPEAIATLRNNPSQTPVRWLDTTWFDAFMTGMRRATADNPNWNIGRENSDRQDLTDDAREYLSSSGEHGNGEILIDPALVNIRVIGRYSPTDAQLLNDYLDSIFADKSEWNEGSPPTTFDSLVDRIERDSRSRRGREILSRVDRETVQREATKRMIRHIMSQEDEIGREYAGDIIKDILAQSNPYLEGDPEYREALNFLSYREISQADYGMGRPANQDPMPVDGEPVGGQRRIGGPFNYINDPVTASNPQPAAETTIIVRDGEYRSVNIREGQLRVVNVGGRYMAAYGGTESGTELTWSPLSLNGEVIFDQGRIAVKLGLNQEIVVRTSDTPIVSQPTAEALPTAPAPAQSSLSRFVYESNMEDFLKTPDFKSHAVPVEGHQEISVVADNATGRIHHYLSEGEMISPTEAVVTFRLAEDGTIAEVIFHDPQLNFLKDGFEKMKVDYNNSLNPTAEHAGLPPVAPLALGMPEGFEDLQYRIGNEAADILAPHLAGQESINVRGLIRALRKFRDRGEVTGELAELEVPTDQLAQLRAKLIEVHGEYVAGRVYRFGKIEEAINNGESMDQTTVEASLETLRRIAAQPNLAALIGADRLANLQTKLEARLSTTTEPSAPTAPIANPIVAVLINEYHLSPAQVEQVMRLFTEQGLSEQEFISNLAEIAPDLAANIGQLKEKLSQAILAQLSARAANDPQLAERLQEQFRAGGGRLGVGAVVSEIGQECFQEYSQGGIMAALGSNSPALQFLLEPVVESEFWTSMARGQFGAWKQFFSTSMPATGAGIVGANVYNMLLNLFGVSQDSNARGLLSQVTMGVLSAMGYSALASGGATSTLGRTLSRLLSNPVTQRIFVALALNAPITDTVFGLAGLNDDVEVAVSAARKTHPNAFSALSVLGDQYAVTLINLFSDSVEDYTAGLIDSSVQAEITGHEVLDALSALTLLYVARNPIFLNPELYKGRANIEVIENPELADPAYFSQLVGQYEQALAGQDSGLGAIIGEENAELFDPTPQADPAELAYAMLVGIHQGQDLSAQMPAFRALGMMDENGNVNYSSHYVQEGQRLYDERSRRVEQQGLVVEVGSLVNGRLAEAITTIQNNDREVDEARENDYAPTLDVNLPHVLFGNSRGNIDETALMNYVFVENEDAIWDISHQQRITYFTIQQVARALAGEAVDIDFSDPTVQAVLKYLQHNIPLTE